VPKGFEWKHSSSLGSQSGSSPLGSGGSESSGRH